MKLPIELKRALDAAVPIIARSGLWDEVVDYLEHKVVLHLREFGTPDVIGMHCGRSERWAYRAIEKAKQSPPPPDLALPRRILYDFIGGRPEGTTVKGIDHWLRRAAVDIHPFEVSKLVVFWAMLRLVSIEDGGIIKPTITPSDAPEPQASTLDPACAESL